MTDAADYFFLLHHTPPIEFGKNPTLLFVLPDGNVEFTSLDRLSRTEGRIVTHSFSLLVDWFRHKSLPLPRTIVDLESAKKLIVGMPKSDFGAELPWDMPSMLRTLIPPKYDSAQVRAAFTTHMSKPTSTDFGDFRLMSSMAAGLPSLWSETQEELEQRGETHRFQELELPIYNILLDAQYRGINIDTKVRDQYLGAVEDEYIFAHHQLAIRQKIDVDRALFDIDYLKGLLKEPLRGTDPFSPPKDVIKARKDADQVCALLHSVESTRQNKRILLRTGVDDGRCFPLYDALGTVTGRIMAVDPHLQHLKKKYRGIISPRSGYTLVYLDYSQFEPNILASISKDPGLSLLCAESDLYERLSTELCGSAAHRDTMKIMFLAYSYGKQANTLNDFLIGCGLSIEEAEEVIQKRLIPLFVGIEGWKLKIQHALTQEGRIGTLFGNHRYRAKEGQLDAREMRWAISQVIQGTGSLILKKAIIAIKDKLPEACFILPMHDALLVEVPEAKATEVTRELLQCFRDAFLDVCPAGSSLVRVKPFAEDVGPVRTSPAHC